MKIHGVDLDRTLAFYDKWRGPDTIGEPIPLMVERVKKWLLAGDRVDIFTARVHPSNGSDTIVSTKAIREWFFNIFGVKPIVTCQKDPIWDDVWDDLAIQVIPNTGRRADGVIDMDMESEADGMGAYICEG